MDELKRKISEEFDERRSSDLSEDLRREIESSSGDIQSYADDLIRVESFLQSVREQDVDEPEWNSFHGEILKGLEEEGMSGNDEKLLDPPMPDGSEDDVSAEAKDEEAPSSEEEEKPTDQDEDDDEPRMRLTATRLKGEKKDAESSGMINLGALVQEHRQSMAPPTSGSGSLDIPPAVVGAREAQGKQGGSKLVPVAVVLGVLAVVAIAAVVGVKNLGNKDEDQPVAAAPQIDRAALEAELKEKILEELKAEGMIGEEAEEEAARKAQLMAQAEIEKQQTEAEEATEAAEGEEEEASTTTHTSHKKRYPKKKSSGGGGSTTAKDESSTGGYTPPTTSSGSKSKPTTKKTDSKPKSAADDLASLLEEAGGSKKGGVLDSPTPKKTSGSSAPDPSLPKKLDKKAIRKAMNKIQPKIMQCGKDKVGTVSLSFVVSGDGTVKKVTAKPGPITNDGAVKKCILNVAGNAKFDKFQASTQSVVYYFVFAPKPGV